MVEGVTYLYTERLDLAARTLTPLMRSNGELAQWARVYIAMSAAESGDLNRARRLTAGLDPDMARDWGWVAISRGYERQGYFNAAAATADEASKRLEDPYRLAQAKYTAGRIRLLLNDTVTAREDLRTSIEVAPASFPAHRAAMLLQGISPLQARDLAAIATSLARGGETESAASAFSMAARRATTERETEQYAHARRLLLQHAESPRMSVTSHTGVNAEPAISPSDTAGLGATLYRIRVLLGAGLDESARSEAWRAGRDRGANEYRRAVLSRTLATANIVIPGIRQ